MTRTVGASYAKELIYTGRRINGNEAYRIGLVNHVVEDNATGDAAFDRALKLAEEILPQVIRLIDSSALWQIFKRMKGPLAVRLAKMSIDLGAQVDLNTALLIEQQCYAQV